jgi:hypothetical protein
VITSNQDLPTKFAGRARLSSSVGRAARGAVIALTVVLAGIVLVLGRDWLRVIGPGWLLARHAAAVVLAMILAGYFLVVAVAVFGLGFLGMLLRWSARRGARNPSARLRRRSGQWMLLCGSVVVGAVLAETAAAGWLAWIHRMPSLPSRFVESESSGDEIGIVIIGGSSAMGVPYDGWLSLGEIIGRELKRAIPDRRFRVDVLAEKGAALETMHLKLAGLTRRPDVLVVYAGHNEFLARFSLSNRVAYYDDERSLTRSGTWIRRARGISSVCRLVAENIEKQRLGVIPARSFGAIEGTVGRPCCTPAEADAVVTDFRRRLETIVTDCERIGCVPVVIVPLSNDATDPSQSYANPWTSHAARRELYLRLRKVRDLEEGNPQCAITAYRGILVEQPKFAEAHYRLARLLVSAGAIAEANRHFVLARDYDGLPMRSTTAIEAACRSVAERHKSQIVLVDGPAVLRTRSRQGILDDQLFHDNVHLNLKGYLALAEAVLGGLKARRAFGWPASTPVPVLDSDRCATEFGVDAQAWATICRRVAVQYDRLAYLTVDSNERANRSLAYKLAAQRIERGTPLANAGIPGW